MKKFLIKLLVLIAVFIGGTVLFFNLMNSQSTVSAEELTSPTLPVMCIDIDGKKVNQMFGNVEELDQSQIRDFIIPLTTDREITVSYKAYNNNVRSVSYEVYAPDTGEVIENAKIGDFRDDGENKSATFSLNEPILMDREYPIKFTIRTKDREIYYYARLLQRANLVPSKFVEFVYNFYEMSINKQASADLNAYIEPDETIKNTNFANVDIHSSLEMISWGNMNPKIIRKAVPAIREINPETCTVTCDYLISSDKEDGRSEVFHVHEYYRMRYYNSKMMLLNFERQALQEFDGAGGQIISSGVDLGISTRDVQYISDSSSSIVAFVQDNALWVFNTQTQKISRVFTFHSSSEDSDERDDHNGYGIKIMSVSESGDVNFAVYGYMNKGEYEGRTGIMLGRYSGERSDIEVKAFIPYSGSFEMLSKYVEKLSYMNPEGTYFVYMDDSVIRADLESGKISTVVTGIIPECFAVSKDNSMIAWMDEMEPYASDNITLMDLENEETRKISAGDREHVKALGFINDDFVYGVADRDDIYEYASGKRLFAMKKVIITSFDGEDGKEYAPDDLWISDVTIEEGLIELQRVSRKDGKYVEASTDDIMNNKQTEGSLVTTDAKYTNRKGTVINLVFPNVIKNISPLVSYGKIRTRDENVTLEMTEELTRPERLYYVYGEGELKDITGDPAKAVMEADAMVETALDRDGRYLYERGNTDPKNELSNEYIPKAMLSGKINAVELDEDTGDEYDVINLSGCTLQQVLYQVSCGNAVAALKDDGTVTVIVGYDRYNTLLYNFDTGEHYYYGINDSTAMFEAGGNEFVTYLENVNTVKNNE